MTSLPENRPSPIREDDRDTAVQRVQDAFTQGHISNDELDERLDQVLTATTHHEIEAALASLPAESPGTTSTISAGAGRIKRRGVWRVPRHLKVESAFGRVHLDLSRATFEQGAVDIELQLGTGRAKIIVPRDAVVDLDDLNTGWKDSHYKSRRQSGSGGVRIRISGSMGFGRLKIRHARR